MKVLIQVYKNPRTKQWRWRMRARNNEIIGASTESFVTRGLCRDNLAAVTGLQLPILGKHRGNWQRRVYLMQRAYIQEYV